jgi:hypothetical protein
MDLREELARDSAEAERRAKLEAPAREAKQRAAEADLEHRAVMRQLSPVEAANETQFMLRTIYVALGIVLRVLIVIAAAVVLIAIKYLFL